ncbi:MAG: ABC transporter ATP-binding protein [Clostridia bacterium]
MLSIEGLTKVYKNSDRKAVDDLYLQLAEGEIFGFLGKNGAGKSTTIKCITGILPFEIGKITIDGFDIQDQPKEAKMRIGYVPDNHAVYEKMTAREYIYYMGILYGATASEIKERSEIYLKMFSLDNVADNQIRSYSHGMKQKVSIIAAIIHNPKLWILDEPLMGLDPQSSMEIRNFMEQYAHDYGNTIFFSSHNIDLVEKLCDRVAIIKDGILLEIIDVQQFKLESVISLERYFIESTMEC